MTIAVQVSQSQLLFEQAASYIPGGVSSANRLVEPNLVFTRAQGAYLYDADGKRYIDYHAAFGPPILGHCHPSVSQRVGQTITEIDLALTYQPNALAELGTFVPLDDFITEAGLKRENRQ